METYDVIVNQPVVIDNVSGNVVRFCVGSIWLNICQSAYDVLHIKKHRKVPNRM